MKIVVNNDKDKKKFYRLLPLYKLIRLRYEVQSDDDNINIIVNALNIRNRKKRITYIYDTAIKIIDDDVNGENICGFKNNQCYANQCNKRNQTNGCCRRCRYRSDKGCPTANLACKLFNCSEVKRRRKVITYEDLKILKVLSLRQRMIVKSDYYSLREDVLKDLYSYSVIFATIKILIRFLKNKHYVNSKEYL